MVYAGNPAQSDAAATREASEPPQAKIEFEGTGLARSSAAAANAPDEEFDYALADGKREVLLLISTT